MNIAIFNAVGPQVFFFIVFFLAFSVLELVLILILNRLEFMKWKFMIDVVIRAQVEHKKIIRLVLNVIILVVAVIFMYSTPIVYILRTASSEIQIFAVVLVVAMAFIYLTTTRKFAKLAIEKLIHKYLYALVSLIFFVVIILIMNESYGLYQNFVNETFINPTVQKVQINLEESKKQNLLKDFRIMARQGSCKPVDYALEDGTGIRHFIFVASDVEFIEIDESIDVNDPEYYARGRECSNGEETFLLTPYGNWYWVIDQQI